jgi:uncharacterized protein YndB with AHSA1/START domain
MNHALMVENEVLINASLDRVWDVLTNPDETRKYMFGCETVSDWKSGSPLLWRAEVEGKVTVFVKGYIVSIKPGQMLAYTTFDPNNPSIEDIPENYLTVTYNISDVDGQTRLVVTQGDYSMVADGEKRYNDTVNGGGWASVLTQIKKVAEA